MPLYEYVCDACAHHFEVIQKYSDAPIEVCPKCGGHVQKMLSSPAIQFKGTGWYVTDYARKSSSEAGKTSDSGKTDKPSEKTEKTEKTEKSDKSADTKSADGSTTTPSSTSSKT
jgi:putative FmdB family regulatory protein